MATKDLRVSDFFTDDERAIIVRGLEKIMADADKVSASAERMNMLKASKEVQVFKHEVESLKNKMLGKQTLV